jgi:site-specific DNA recombinase
MPDTNGHGPKPERVALYLRVSSEEQREKATIKIQREFLDGYRQLHGLEVAGWYQDDGVSGTISLHERPEGRRLLEDAKEGNFQTVLVYRLDRFGRSLLGIVDAHDRLEALQVALPSTTEPVDTSSPSGRLIFQMLASFAEYERATIRERTQAGLHRAFRNGKHAGRIPYGYDIAQDNSFVVVEDEACIVREIIANIANRATLYSEFKRLNDEGIPSTGYRFRGDEARRGTRLWSPSTVRDIVHQTAYSGIHRVRIEGGAGSEQIIERPVPAIVEPGLIEQAEAQLTKNKSRAGELRKNGRKYLLSGLIRCGICGFACTGRTTTSRDKKYSYYGCVSYRADRTGSAPPHRALNIPADWLESLVWTDVRAFLANPGEVLERVRERTANEDDHAELEERHDSLKRRLAEAEGELDRLLNLYATG